MVLGFPRLEDYLHHSRSHGAIVGRVANRTARRVASPSTARPTQLTAERGRAPPARRRHRARQPHLGDGDRHRRQHGAPLLPQPRRRGGLSRRPSTSPSPSAWRGRGSICEMAGTPDRPTPISLANHSYYNLGGAGTVRDHLLWVDAHDYTPTDADADPDRRDPPGRGHRARLLRRARDRRHRPRPQPRPRPRPRPQAPGRPRALPAHRARSSSSGPTSRALQLFDASAMTIDGPGPRRPELRPLRRLLPRGAALPRQPAQPGLAEHRLHAGEPVFPAACGRDRTCPDGPGAHSSPLSENRCR